MTQSRDQQHDVNLGAAPARPPTRRTIQVQRGDRPRVGVNAAQERRRGQDAIRVGHTGRRFNSTVFGLNLGLKIAQKSEISYI